MYARRLLDVLARTGYEIHVTISDAAARVITHELMLPLDLENGEATLTALVGRDHGNFVYHHHRDLEAPIASGSFRTEGMVIIPCSMGTIGRIAAGVSTGLIDRAADVCLKERRRLVLVPRETPYSEIHLQNMLRVTQAGAVVLPASPGYYTHPRSVDDLVNFVVARVLDHLGLESDLVRRWGEAARRFVEE